MTKHLEACPDCQSPRHMIQDAVTAFKCGSVYHSGVKQKGCSQLSAEECRELVFGLIEEAIHEQVAIVERTTSMTYAERASMQSERYTQALQWLRGRIG